MENEPKHNWQDTLADILAALVVILIAAYGYYLAITGG